MVRYQSLRKFRCAGLALGFLALACFTRVEAEPRNPNTDWFHKAGWGVFVHYLEVNQNNPEHWSSLGKRTTWDECVKELDTEKLADQLAQAKAGYLIFTMHQRTHALAAPNATFDRLTGYRPGEACAKRDLVEDLYQSLHKRGIRLMLYWTGDGPLDDPKAAKALGITAEKYSDEFVRRWASVVREYGERYKDKVAGWWVDGCLALWGYDEKKLGILAKALKAGNPERIIAFNVGAFPKVRSYSKWDDFTTGETREFTRVPDGRWTEGVQWHVLSWLGSTAPWGWASPGSRYRKRELADYVRRVNENGGVVSIDVMLYRDGSLDRSQLEMLRAIGPPAPKTQ